MSSLISASVGGHHGEAVTSYDGRQKKVRRKEDEVFDEANEGQEETDDTICSRRAQVFEARQSQLCNQSAAESTQEKGGVNMDETPVPTKAKAAQVLGNMFNDPRITNVLMLVLVLIGMGGAEAVQSQVCSL